MTTTGSVALAQRLLNYCNRQGGSDKGFRAIGEGCYRQAFLHLTTNLVYKVGATYINNNEVMNARNLGWGTHNLDGVCVRVPRTEELWIKGDVSVIVQEFAADCVWTPCDSAYGLECTCEMSPCHNDVGERITRWSRLIDIHEENVLFNPNTLEYWFIDLGG